MKAGNTAIGTITGNRKGQIHALDLAVWIMVVSSLFLLIAPVIDVSSAVSESKANEEISEKAIMYSSEILMTPPNPDGSHLGEANKIGLVKNGKVSAQLSKEFIDMCMFSHEKTREMLGLYHTNNNLDYSVKIWYPAGEIVGQCSQNTNTHGLVVNRYGLDEKGNPIIITLEVYEVE